jgi:hypothetical protein
VHDRSIKLRYGRNLVTKHSTFSYPSCDYIINVKLPNSDLKQIISYLEREGEGERERERER